LTKNPSGIFRIDGHPELYVRTFHGLNTWDYDHHHQRLYQQAMGSDWIKSHEKEILDWMLVLDIPKVNICTNTGQTVFTT
jgi:hypothetical protein